MLEREKQAAVYVRVSAKGRVQRRPHTFSKQAQAEIARALRLSELAHDAHGSRVLSRREYNQLCEIIAAVFETFPEGAA